MSFNQSRSDKNDNTAQFNRKLGRSGSSNNNSSYQRSVSGGGRGSGGPAPNPSSGRQSYRKTNNATQGQGGQSRPNVPAPASSDSSNSSSALPHNLLNGAHLQPQLQDTPITGAAPRTTDASLTQRSSRADVPKAPSSQSSTNNSNAKLPTTPAKGDTSKGGFSLQFGSISPGFMNMQVPARTNSAPPNLDEQKRDQVRNDSHRSGSTAPFASVPKPQLPGKEVHTTEHFQGAESHLTQKVRNDVPVSLVPLPSATQKHSAIPLSGMPMQVPFHQPQGPIQFGGPNPQVQSQGLPPTSLHGPMPIPISIGNSSQVPQQVYLPGTHPHPGMMHGQNMGFAAQMGSQMPHQMSNIGINMPQQFSQQQGGKFSTPRKVVKITHPDTHEELRLDKGLPGLRSHPNMATQSQQVAPYPSSHTLNYFPTGYSYYPTNPVPLPGSQVNPNSQGSRFNYPVSQGSHGTLFPNPSAPHSLTGSKMGPSSGDGSTMGRTRDVHPSVSSAAPSTAQVSIKPASDSVADKVVPTLHSDSAAGKSESTKFLQPPEEARSLHLQRDIGDNTEPVLLKPKISGEVSSTASLEDKQSAGVGAARAEIISDAVPLTSVGSSDGSLPGLTTDGGRRKGSLSRTNSIKDQQRKADKKGYTQSQQVGGSSASVIPVQSADHSTMALQEKATLPLVESAEGLSESSCEVLSRRNFNTPEGDESQSAAMSELNAVNGAKEPEFESKDSQIEAKSATSKVAQAVEEEKSIEVATSNNEIEYTEVVGREHDTVCDDSVVSARLTSDSIDAEVFPSNAGDKVSVSHASAGVSDSPDSEDNSEGQEMVSKSGLVDSVAPGEVPNVPDVLLKEEGTKDISSLSNTKDKLATESNKAKNAAAPKKKKRKEILQKADAAGTTSDLYMAYKGPEEKELILPPESLDSASTTEVDSKGIDTTIEDLEKESGAQSKFEPDDWEDAADIGTPKLETSENGELGGVRLSSSDGGIFTKKYSRDFLLTFAEIYNGLPENFNVAPNIAAALMNDHVGASHYGRDSFPSPGRAMDRGSGGPRLDRRSSNVGDDDKWSKGNPQFGPGRDAQLDLGYGSNVVGFRPGQGGNFGVLRNPRVQSPIQYPGGILAGPLQSMGSMQRSNSDADRWQRATSKGLIPSPQTPSPAIHKAERKYEVGKVTDEEQAKQRQLKGILNKLTPQNFEKLFQQVKEVNIDSAITLTGVISQIFDKALMEPTFCEMYADFCFHLAGELPDFNEDSEKITFKRVLLNKCQEEFERGEREEEEANRVEEGEVKQSEEEREEKRINARRRMLGNIRLIGELYKKKMLTEKIMHECIKKLLGQYQNHDEEDIEALCKLMSTIGEMIDHPRAKGHMDAYFEMMAKLSTNMKLSSRVRFMLQDAIDLRVRKWQQRRKIEGPKKIEEVHRDAAHERQAQTSRLARGPGMNPSVRRGPPMDFGPRGGSSMLPSPNAQMGGFRGYPNQARGFGNQDIRVEERSTYERTLSVPLPQRSLGDDTITLGPQGGLARGMSIRGTPSLNVPFMDRPHSSGDSRRIATGLNGYGSGTEGSSFNLNEDNVQRYAPERYINQVLDQSGGQERSMPSGNRDLRDRSFDRSLATSPPTRVPASTSMQTAPEKVLSEERLRDMSIAAIKEFYSAKDEKEVALCIRDLKTPTFYPSMIPLWVTDSFERKDMERDILARLLVSLTSFYEGLLSQTDLLGGFESALSSLEDAVNDAPKAPEFLGKIFAKVVVENVIPLGEIGQIIYRGGEEPGSLRETGLAGDVLGSVLEMIQSEKGDSVLNEIRSSLNLRLEDFKPPGQMRSRKLEKFI